MGTGSSLPPAARGVALGLVAIGGLLMVGAVFADPLGLTGGGEGFGWKQLIAAIAGLVLLLGGLAWLLQPLSDSAPEPAFTDLEPHGEAETGVAHDLGREADLAGERVPRPGVGAGEASRAG